MFDPYSVFKPGGHNQCNGFYSVNFFFDSHIFVPYYTLETFIKTRTNY